jgi:CheY-like chemotaxis protein
VRLAAAHALRGLGYRVSEADSADAAMALLNKGERPDVLFTDVVMPGTITARQLAAHARRVQPNLAVVFTSGYTDASPDNRSRIDPGVILVSKPWRIDDLARRLRAAIAEASAPRPTGRLHILLVEDDPAVRMTTADLLADMGHEVRQAASAGQGLALMDGIDLLISDVGLPDRDGREFVAEARRRRPDLRVIIASGRDRAGVDATAVWLEKPFNAAALRAAVSAVRAPQVALPS